MGWQGYEETIAVGMLFKKMYCHKCGCLLKKKKVAHLYLKSDPGYSNDLAGHGTIGMDKKMMVHYIYHCPNCGSEITYDEQRIVAKKQKRLKKKILNEND
jgi:RNase P subunit RPR2